MNTFSIPIAWIAAGLLLGVAGPAGAERLLEPGASQAEIQRALLNTRTLSRRRPEGAVQSPGPATVHKPAAAAPPKSGAARPPSGGRAGPVQPPEPRATSAGDQDQGPASFQIFFDLNSANLRPDAYPVLDRLGAALGSAELRDFRFVVEGHTDASGSETFNLGLSEERARSVREYLVEKHNIDPARLEPVGRGESELYDAGHPLSGKNRRVRFVDTGGETGT
jgi:outer membrane protein OmpA-like peptidoglycan-associated protein